MDGAPPYLSVVVAARNDDHGQNLLQRMQAFVNAFISQCQRFNLDAELVLVEWNPPADCERLACALRWPADTRPCRVRIIEVPASIHERYQHAAALPLYQMIAKNAGIRRARGRFILATNIDILFSDELIGFLAGGRLEEGRMYRVDRYDVMAGVPVDGPVEERLAYCRSHLIRLYAREGVFSLTPGGLRALAETDVAAADSGVSYGAGWYPAQQDGNGRVFRWAGQDAELVVRRPACADPTLAFELEPGPGVGYQSFALQVLDSGNDLVAETVVEGRSVFSFRAPAGVEAAYHFRFHVIGGGLPVPNDPHILNFRVFTCGWVAPGVPLPGPRQPRLPEDSSPRGNGEILESDAGLALGAGWYPVETSRGGPFRWVENEAELVVSTPEGPRRELVVNVRPGPAVGYRPARLLLRDWKGQLVATAAVRKKARSVKLAVPWRPGRVQVFTLQLEGGGRPVAVPSDPRTLRFCVFHCGWAGQTRGPEKCELGQNDLEIVLRAPDAGRSTLRLEIELGPGVKCGRFELQVLDPGRQILASRRISGRQVMYLPLAVRAGKTHVFCLHAAPVEPCGATEPAAPAVRLWGFGWAESPVEVKGPEEGAEFVSAVDLHTIACGDFTLMAREHWMDARGYPEFDMYSYNLDSLLSYAAHHGGAREEVLPEPMRIYHIEHAAGSGWTPEGQSSLFERLRARGIPYLEDAAVFRWAIEMRRRGAGLIFNGEGWGLAADSLREMSPPL